MFLEHLFLERLIIQVNYRREIKGKAGHETSSLAPAVDRLYWRIRIGVHVSTWISDQLAAAPITADVTKMAIFFDRGKRSYVFGLTLLKLKPAFPISKMFQEHLFLERLIIQMNYHRVNKGKAGRLFEDILE